MKVCTACNTENDDTRVFCLHCGQRLTQSVLVASVGVKQAPVGASAPPLPSSKPVKKQIPGKPLNTARNLFSLFWNLLFWAVFAGMVFGIYLISQAPAALRPAVKKDSTASVALASFLKKASTTPGGAWMGSEDAINNFLLENVKLVPVKTALGIHTEFKRCFVELGEGRLDFVMEQSLEDYPLYFSLQLEPYSQNGDLKVRVIGASLGQLPVPSLVAPHILAIWRPCFDSLGAILETLDSASSASVTPKSLVVRWPGKSDS
jgi:hypothetical protein